MSRIAHAASLQGGPLALVEARHPLLECLDEGAPFQPNDTFLALNSSLHIITGGWAGGGWTVRRFASFLSTADQPLPFRSWNHFRALHL